MRSSASIEMIKNLKFDQKIVVFEKNQAFAVGRGLAIFAKTAKNVQKTKNPVKTGFLLFVISRTTKRSF